MPRTISDADLNQLIATDPQIQRIISGVWGETPVSGRPGDTPKPLEAANDRASKQIASVLESRGIQLPKHTFINPRSSSVEHMRGWAGLPTPLKVAIVVGGTLATAGAAGAFGGGAAGVAGAAGGGGTAASVGGAAAIPSIGVTGGLTAGAFPAIAGTTGAGLAGTAGATAAAGGLLPSTSYAGTSALPIASSAGNMAGGAGATAASGGGFLNSLRNPRTLGDIGSILGKRQEGEAAGAVTQAGVTQGQDRNAISLYEAQNDAENAAARTDLDRQQFGASEQGRNAKNAIHAALLGGGMPRTSINVPGIKSASISGGMLDALKNNPDALAALASLQGQAKTGLDKGPTFTGGATVKPPTLTPLPDTGGKSQSFLNTLATIGQIVGTTKWGGR